MGIARQRLSTLVTAALLNTEGMLPGAQAVQDALWVLEGKAVFDGPMLPVYTRLAAYQGAILSRFGQ